LFVNQSSITIFGLNPNTLYYYTIQTSCKSDKTKNLATSGNFKTTGVSLPCLTPSGIIFLKGFSTVSVGWSVPTTAGLPIKSFDVCAYPIKPPGSTGAPLDVCFLEFPSTTRSTELGGLFTDSYAYNVVVRLNCANGTVTQASQSFNYVLPSPCQTPSITDITTGPSSATVQWSVPSTSGAPAVSSFDVCVTPIYTGIASTCINNLPAATRSTTLTGLSSNYSYYAVVTLKCANGTETQTGRLFYFPTGGSLVRRNDAINTAMEKSSALTNVKKAEITAQTEGEQKGEDFETPKWGKNTQNKLSIIPNPTKGDITILLPESGYEKLTITNMNGQIVKQVQQPADALFQKVD
jgi:hypothetical protein